jgi:transposase
VRESRIWGRLLGLDHAVVERVEYDPVVEAVVVHARPHARQKSRCGWCGKRSPGYDQGEGRRRWRTLDAGLTQAFLEADAPRVRCAVHGVVVARVPWARHGAGHTRVFDDTVAWLACATAKSVVSTLMRVAWRTVGSIITRVQAEIDTQTDRLAGLRRIGIDEISYRTHHRYLTVVVDHDTGRLVWAAPGHDIATLARFFHQLGPERSARLTHVTADAATWISAAVTRYAPQAIRCADPFPVVKWAQDALDLVRRRVWNSERAKPGGRATDRRGREGMSAGDARRIRTSRWLLWKNPENLTDRQRAKLDWISVAHPTLYRAYQLKEALRLVFRLDPEDALHALDRWLVRAARSRIPEFVATGQRVRRALGTITATVTHRLSNALVESTNTKLRLLTRNAYGFTNPEALIALGLLALGGHKPALPGR